MSGNAIHGSIPYELSLISSLYALDLSDNQLSGQIPYNISGYEKKLRFLSFSNNKLHGPIPLMLSMFSSLHSLFLDGNSLSGCIPSNFFNSSSEIQNLDLSDNSFIGKIPSQIKNSIELFELAMSNNHFEGSIPSELTNLEGLKYLDISQNKLVGCVPSFVNSFARTIHLSDNNLSCLSKNMFEESSDLVTLDLSNNAIVSGFHDLMHDLQYTGLNILLLKGNHFKGNIPNALCHLTSLTILDLSYNNFVGEIPSCFGKMPFENKDPETSRTQFNGKFYPPHETPIQRFGKERDSFTSVIKEKIRNLYNKCFDLYVWN
ncbi:unnamed protein product [Trifolium pratense]|uniref:Uncharacterized protein n=1 Tax=Trifolium pratense TaxID=57577 RepID=A0ACB0LRE0_TRIPR|nr:unnamed protein product [Trifolium pratense]